MGLGDELIGTGLARGATSRGKRVAFGDGKRIIWSPQAHEIFRGNPNVAPPGDENAPDLEWIEHYPGRRLYGEIRGGCWHFRDFACPPGEVFLTAEEKRFALGRIWGSEPVVIVEPRVKPMGACAGANKQWPQSRYGALVDALKRETGIGVVAQLVPPAVRPALINCEAIETPTFRHALALLGLATLYIGPEGGLHHGAAAMGTPAVVIFGGFNTPRATGYAWHENLTAVGEPCGMIAACQHCREAMASIGVDQVLEAARRQLRQREAAE